MKRYARAASLATAVVCWTTAGCATRGDVEDLMLEHQQIREHQDALDQQIAALNESMTRLLQGIRADFKADLDAMRGQVAALEAAVRGTETRIEQLRRIPPPSATPGVNDTISGQVDQVSLYNSAITDYQQGRLDLARQGFEEYLRLFPRGLSAADAQYWLGIVAYDQGSYDEAIQALRTVLQRYADSSKAPLALRKIGDAYRAQGDDQRARLAYEELVERYPNSAEAQAVRQELGE